LFGSVFIKKNNQIEIFFFEKKTKPNRNRVKPTDFGSVRFFQGKNRFKPIWLGFFRFFRFFRFGSVFFSGFLSVLVRFGFFGFLLIKPKPNRTGRFFKKCNRFNRFFFSVRFFRLFFFQFSRFNRFSGFFAHPYTKLTNILFTFIYIHYKDMEIIYFVLINYKKGYVNLENDLSFFFKLPRRWNE
jgi:hypothetical protein